MLTELQEREWEEPQLRQRLEPELRRRSGPATLGDIVAATGLPAERTEPVLRALLDEYDGRLAVDENGELLYSFPRGLHRPTTTRDVLRQVRDTLWEWFKVAYKAGIFVVLLAYFLVFLVIMIAAIVALIAASNSSDSDLDLEGCGDGCGDGCFWLWFIDPPTYRTPSGSFQAHRATPYRPKPPGQARRVPPWLTAFEFVFGPEEAKPDPLAQERRLLGYIRERRGRVTATDIVALTGCDLDTAEKTLLHLMVAHGGDVEVSENGTLIYTFDRLMVSAGEDADQTGRRWLWWWEEPERPGVLNRNSEGANWGLGLMNAFNLAWSAWFTLGAPGLVGAPGWIPWALGPVPLVFSLLFFIIPMVRRSLLNRENAARERRNARREVARKIFRLHIGSDELPLVTAEELFSSYAERGDRVRSLRELREIIEELAAAWDAEPESDADGRIGWRFTRLREEWRDVSEARQAVDPAQFRLGAIDYDSDQGD